MRDFKYIWLLGIIGTALLIAVPILALVKPAQTAATTDPWSSVPQRVPHTDHTELMPGPYETGQEVTAVCLECHEEAADQVMHTTHFTWESEPVLLPGRDEPVTIGKANQLNNFCIGIQNNWPGCTSCHAGYSWKDGAFQENATEVDVDCLACHADMGLYAKGSAGLPVEGIDLAAAAQSVNYPTRQNCGSCHFNGGGGNAVKHGDMDETLYFPTANIDVHMGRFDLQCIDCHGSLGFRGVWRET